MLRRIREAAQRVLASEHVGDVVDDGEAAALLEMGVEMRRIRGEQPAMNRVIAVHVSFCFELIICR